MKTTEILDNLTTDQLLNILPENMPLYKDSGLWNIYEDQFKTELFHQGVNESFKSFLKRSILELEKSEYSDSLHFDILEIVSLIFGRGINQNMIKTTNYLLLTMLILNLTQ